MSDGLGAGPRASAFDYQFDLLKVELGLVDSAIRQHDEITKSIKNWAIVTWTASMGAALSRAPFNEYIWLVAAIALLFWSVDALFRRIQRSFIARSEEIADFINSDCFKSHALSGDPITFGLMKMRRRRPDWLRSYFESFRYYSVATLYVGLAGLSVVVWLIVWLPELLS